MSIACWDGKTLAVDSRRISTKKASSQRTISNDSIKLTFPQEQVLFKKEEVLVIARVGKVRLTKLMQEAVLDGHDVENYFRTRISKKQIQINGVGTLLIITNQSAWQFRLSGRGGVHIQHVGNQAWSIGSGNKIANYLMRFMGLSPEHAVSSIILGHSSCGGNIRIWRRSMRISHADQLKVFPDIPNEQRKIKILIDAMRSIDPTDIDT